MAEHVFYNFNNNKEEKLKKSQKFYYLQKYFAKNMTGKDFISRFKKGIDYVLLYYSTRGTMCTTIDLGVKGVNQIMVKALNHLVLYLSFYNMVRWLSRGAVL